MPVYKKKYFDCMYYINIFRIIIYIVVLLFNLLNMDYIF